MRPIRWRWVGLALVVLVGVLSVAVVLAFRSDWFRDRLRQVAMRQANQYLTGTLTIGHLSGSLLHDVTLDDVRLSDIDGPVFTARRVTVRYDPMTLLHRHLVLDQVACEIPTLRLAQRADGWNVSHLLRRTAAGGADFDLKHVHLEHGDLDVRPATARARHVAALSADVHVWRTGGQLSVDLARAAFHDDGSGYDAVEVAGSLRDGGRTVDLTARGAHGQAALAGHVQLSADAAGSRLTATADLTDVNLEDFFGAATWRSTLTGHTEVRGHIGPSLASTTLDYRGRLAQARALGYEGRDVEATGTWRGGVLSVDASGSGYGAGATIHATWRVPIGGPGGPFDGTGTFRHVSLAALPAALHVPPVVSTLAGRYQIHVDADEIRGAVTLDDSTAAGARIASGAVGSVDRAQGITTYTASGAVAGLDLQSLASPLDLPFLAASRYRSQLTGSVAITGAELCAACEVRRTITATADLGDSTLGATHVSSGRAQMELVGTRLTITGTGEVAHLNTETLGLPAAMPVDLNGSASGSVVFANVSDPITLDNVDVTGSASLGASTISGVTLDQAHGDVALTGGVLTTRQLEAQASGLHATATGRAALGRAGSSALDLTVDADDLAPLGGLVHQPLFGAGSVTAHLTGPHDDPQATGKVSLRDVAYGPDLKALSVNGDFTARLPGWDPAQADVTASAQSSFLSVKSVAITSATGHTHLVGRRLDADAELTDAARDLKLSGTLALGSTERTVELHALAVTDKGQTWALPTGAQATVRISPTEVEVAGVRLSKGPSSVDLAGTWHLTGAGGAAEHLTLRAGQVQLADIEALALGTQRVKGVVNAEATLAGPIANPQVTGHLDVTGGTVGTTSFASLAATASLANHDLTLEATLVQSGANQLKAAGHVPVGSGALTSPQPMAVAITSTPIDLGLAQLFTASLSKVTGTGVVNLQLTGTPQAPIVDGTVKVANGAFTLVGSGVSYRNAAVALSFKANHLALETLTLSDDDGHELHATGGLDVLGAGARGFNVQVTTAGLHILNNEMGTLQLGADLQFTGDFAAPKIAGQVSLESGRLQVDRILNKTIKSAYRETPEGELPSPAEAAGAGPSGPPPAKGLSDRVAVDVTVNLPDNLVMRGRNLRVSNASVGLGDMNVIAGGSMHVLKPAGGQLDIVGGLEIVRGTYTFQGRRFDVARGSTVQFRGEDVSDPALNLSADQSVNGINATVRVSGTAQKPQLTLSSQPPLDQAEILSLIVFGQSVGDLGQTDRTALANSATAMAAGTLTTPLADSIAQALNLDTFEILTPSATEQSPVVSLGSTIGSRIYVGFKQEVGGANSAVSFEYRFTRFLRLVTSFAQGALETHVLERSEAAGVDLLFVFRF